MGQILIAHRDLAVRRLLHSNLLHDGHKLRQAKNLKEAQRSVEGKDYDCVFLEAELREQGASQLGMDIIGPSPVTSVIILATSSSLESVVALAGNNLFQVFAPPFPPQLMRVAAQRACERSNLIRENQCLKAAISRVQQELRDLPSKLTSESAQRDSIATDPLQTMPQADSGQDHQQSTNRNITGFMVNSFDLKTVVGEWKKS